LTHNGRAVQGHELLQEADVKHGDRVYVVVQETVKEKPVESPTPVTMEEEDD